MNNKCIILLSLAATLSLNAFEIKSEQFSIKNSIGIGSILNYEYDSNVDIKSEAAIALYGNVNAKYLYNSKIEATVNISYGTNLTNKMGIKSKYNGLYSEYNNIEESYVFFSEAYVSYLLNDDTNIMLGYQSFSIPFFNKDKTTTILKNSFESFVTEYIGISDLYVIGGYINRMAGNSNNGQGYNIQSHYKSLYADAKGQTAFVGANYNYSSYLELDAYYYNINRIANVAYGEVKGKYVYEVGEDKFLNNYYVQYAQISELEKSNYYGNVIGVKAALEYNDYNINASYNSSDSVASNIKITRGLSPYYTTTETFSIEELVGNASAMKLNLKAKNKGNITYDASVVYASADNNLKELIVEGKLDYNASSNLKMSTALINRKNLNDSNMDKYTIFGKIEYSF